MLKSFINNVELKLIAAVNKFKRAEKGDTTFMSILIILGIVIVLAGVFLGFRDTIVDMVENAIGGLTFGE